MKSKKKLMFKTELSAESGNTLSKNIHIIGYYVLVLEFQSNSSKKIRISRAGACILIKRGNGTLN